MFGGKLDMGRRDSTIPNSNEPIQQRPTSSGLSKPRFVKIRKQNNNNNSQLGGTRSSSLSESGFDSGGSKEENLNDNSRMREVHDQCQSSNAFSFGSIQKDMGFGGGTSSDLNLRGFQFGKPDNEGFVFGANSNGSTGFGGNLGNSLPDEMRNLNIGSGIGSQNAAFSTEDVFLGRTDDKKSYGLKEGTVSMLPEVMRKLNLESSENGVGVGVENTKGSDTSSCANDRKTFIFGNTGNAADTFGERAEFKLPDEMKKLNMKDNTFGERAEFKLPDEMKKLNMEDSGNVSGVETPFNVSFKSDEKCAYVFGNNKDSAGSFEGTVKNRLPGETKKLDMKSNIGDSGFFPDKGFTASRIFVKDTQPYNAVPTPLVFQTAVLGRSSSTGSKSIDAYMPSSSFVSTGTGFPAYGSLFGGVNQKIEFNTKVGAAKDMGLKKNRGKKKQSTPVQQWAAQYDFLKESSSQENPESPGCYSPMDFSPYQETSVTGLGSRETSVAPDDMNCTSSPDAHPSVSTDVTYDDMVTETQSLNISEDNEKPGVEGSENHSGRGFGSQCHLEEFVSGEGIESLRSKIDRFDSNSDASFTASEIEAGLRSNIDSHERGDREQFIPASSSEDVSDTSFTFAASTSSQEPLPIAKRHYKKKYRAKVGQDSYSSISDAKIQLPPSTVQGFGLSSSSLVGPAQAQLGDSSISQNIGGNRSEVVALGIKQESLSTPAATTAAQEACEKWRLRGNQAYANGNLSKAEDYYTQGVNCVSTNETSESLLRALALCYSNRAATRMSLKRMREALEDCKMAAVIDPNFLRVQVRAANCHLALGEIEDALKHFKRCLQTRGGVSFDKKIVIDASNGLEKTQQVSDYINRCTELLKLKTSNDADRALQIISEALPISPYSEKLFEMKAEALFTLRKYEEVVQLCEQSLGCAETNSAPISADCQLENFDVKTFPAKLWRWRLISMSYFYLGKLEEALDFLEKIEKAGSVAQKYGNVNFESSISLLGTVRELLRHKAAGNEAFQSGKQSEAVEHYTSALSCNIESRPFAAICFGNRAAAHQALGQITDAIADCSLAIALDGNYSKVILRRAALHEMIKDYGYAASDLQRLISLLEKQAEDKSNQTITLARSTSTANELTQARLRLSTAEEEAKKGIPLDLYLILGVEPSATASEIRKSYRKAALRHHPDKASQFLARSENGDDGLWKEIAEEVHNDTDRLFKMIGEAYAVLSDPTKRSRYDLEQMKNTQKKGNGSSTPKTSADAQNYPFEKTGSSRHWQEARRSYGSQYSQWSEASRSSKHF